MTMVMMTWETTWMAMQILRTCSKAREIRVMMISKISPSSAALAAIEMITEQTMFRIRSFSPVSAERNGCLRLRELPISLRLAPALAKETRNGEAI